MIQRICHLLTGTPSAWPTRSVAGLLPALHCLTSRQPKVMVARYLNLLRRSGRSSFLKSILTEMVIVSAMFSPLVPQVNFYYFYRPKWMKRLSPTARAVTGGRAVAWTSCPAKFICLKFPARGPKSFVPPLLSPLSLSSLNRCRERVTHSAIKSDSVRVKFQCSLL